MILNEAPANEAILSNVGSINSFTIKATAKSFSILSSGLYANKIRAIIRELSCNAVDSHVAAGKSNAPFDLHLPTSLEPWFAVRDYGVGLSNDQVTNIFTTFFESTKTGSNDFIGALGLGSKSPFSYTDNFTVTAVQSGRRGIYSAFINGDGVPSIALMMEETTAEPNGVEIKFSVNERNDFYKFETEARNVFTHFATRPVVTGSSNFYFNNVEYSVKDIVPGVHSQKNNSKSVAVMGNIAYPIEIPGADTSIDAPLRKLLSCGLEMHFGIGELDFQASREGLSYIPQTVSAIKSKLETLNAHLSVHIAKEANKIDNLWERAYYLNDQSRLPLWTAGVIAYINDTKFSMMKTSSSYSSNAYSSTNVFSFTEDELKNEFNISVRGFACSFHSVSQPKLTPHKATSLVNGAMEVISTWEFPVLKNTTFVKTDTTRSSFERARYHWRNIKSNDNVYVLEAANNKAEVKYDEFLKKIASPPLTQLHVASALTQPQKKVVAVGETVTILRLSRKNSGGGYYRGNDGHLLVWRDAGKINTFDATKTYYYLPLSGFSLVDTKVRDAKDLLENLARSGIVEFNNITIHGVRKGDLEFIKKQANWINLEVFIENTIASLTPTTIISLALGSIDSHTNLRYNELRNKMIISSTSPFKVLTDKFEKVVPRDFSLASLTAIFNVYGNGMVIDIPAMQRDIIAECKQVMGRYPMLALSGIPESNHRIIADYINMVDKMNPTKSI